MHRYFSLLLIAGSILSSPFASNGAVAQDLMKPDVARQLGLEQVWLRPINAPYGAQTIADLKVFVHQADPLEYVEIVQVTEAAKPAKENLVPKDSSTMATAPVTAEVPVPRVFGRLEISRVGKDSLEEGRTEAMRLAGNEVRRLKRRGINAELVTRNVPRVNLYSIATNGMLESRDAETGELNWTSQVGDRRLTFQQLGVDDDFLSVINGDKLIQVDVKTGKVLGTIEMRGTPMFGAINAGDFAMVPMIGGSLEGYPLRDPQRDPFLRNTSGSALAMPTKSPDSSMVAWSTDRGYVFVAEASGKPSVLFRLKTDGIVSGRIATASGDRFFFGTEHGQIYGLRATRTGEVLWSQSFGEPFYDEPAVVGKQLLINSTYGNLVSFDTETGRPTWNRPVTNISKLVGAFGDRLYVATLSGVLAVVDLVTGERVGVYPSVQAELLLINKQTDRLYLISTRGNVQCVRPVGADLPTFTLAPDVSAATPESDGKEKKTESTSPFGVGDEGADGSDPFAPGGSDDPFAPAGGADFGDDDPFAEQ